MLMPIGLCFIDTELRFVRLNDRLAEINRVPAAAHIGKTLREILPEMADDSPLTDKLLKLKFHSNSSKFAGRTPRQQEAIAIGC